MARKRIKLKYRKERAVLSDVLPYEVPLSFTNRHFYDFIFDNRIEIKNREISLRPHSKADQDALKEIICLLCDKKSDVLIPFSYKINHKESEFRELTIPHPRSQIAVIDFYDSCKETILYYCAQSSFSIRRPVRIAKYKFYKDKTHYQKLDVDDSLIEESGKEYENLKSFFVYEDYSNVHKFYESPKFHKCEKKYNYLLSLDISKCFDSIYTHSIAWALLDKNIVKEKLDASKKTFAGRFDKLMQSMNHNETNGIIIGPEFSRIFAELILQSVDRKLELELLEKYDLKNKSDYEIFRYVDDYFIFYNEENDKEKITACLRHTLQEFKLYLNESKSIKYEKPIVTEKTRANQKITHLLNDELNYKFDDNVEEGKEDISDSTAYINSNKLITEFKIIIKECNVEYRDILNYALTIVERRGNKILKNYKKMSNSNCSQNQIIRAIIAILGFAFFIHAMSPQVNTTIKLCRIISTFYSFLKSKSINNETKAIERTIDINNRHLVYKYIYDNILFVVKRHTINEHTQVETQYLLIALSQLGKEYLLEEKILAQYFNIQQNQKSKNYHCETRLNYFSYTVILFYMKNRKKYEKLRKFIEEEIKKEFPKKRHKIYRHTELVMLFFDIISCPYVEIDTKRAIMKNYGVENPELQDKIMNFRNRNGAKQLWFTTWRGFNFGKELDAKQSHEVY